MSRMTLRASSWNSTYARVVISPPIRTSPVVQKASHATRDIGSFASRASSTASEIWSQILSGCPSDTDSEVNKWDMGSPLKLMEIDFGRVADIDAVERSPHDSIDAD